MVKANVKKMPRIKNFLGKTYERVTVKPVKQGQAKSLARLYRKSGCNARVVKNGNRFEVYVR